MSPSLPGRWESPVFPLPTAAARVVAVHGRGKVPRQTTWRRVCVKGELGFAPGDELNFTPLSLVSNPPTERADAATVELLVNAAPDVVTVVRKDTLATGNLTPANWGVKCYCEW